MSSPYRVRPLTPVPGRETVIHVCRGCGETVGHYSETAVPRQPKRWREPSWCGCDEGRNAERRGRP